MDKEIGAQYAEQETSPREFDAIVVHGKNIGEDWNPEDIRAQRFHLSPHSRINVLAAGLLYKQGLSDVILFSTGKTAGADYPSEAQAMKDHLLRIFPSIPESAIMLEEKSLNTWTNAKEVRKIAEEKKFQRLAFVTTGFHLPRTRYLFEKAGVPITGFASEYVLKTKAPRYVDSYINSDLYQKEVKRERKALRIQRTPLGRELLSLVAWMRRNPNAK